MKLKILFVPLMERGHIQPLIGVMQYLQTEGHTIGCFGTRRSKISEQFEAAEIRCRWYPAIDEPGNEIASKRKTDQLRNPKKLLLWSSLSIMKGLDSKVIEALCEAVSDFQPDVVCVDPIAISGVIVAEKMRVPWATLGPLLGTVAKPSWTCPWLETMEQLEPTVREKVEAYGVTSVALRRGHAVSPWLNVLFIPPSLVGKDYHDTQYVGPSKPIHKRGDEVSFPWHLVRSDVPTIYVSSGGGHSVCFDPQTIQTICASLSEDEAQFICSLPGLTHEPWVKELPASCIAVEYTPQRELLEKVVSVAVTHGGINSVLECLTYARPMLVLPVALDQPLQAQAVVELGAGLSINEADFSQETCRAALVRLLGAEKNISKLGEEFEDLSKQNGAKQAALHIENLGLRCSPRLRH